MDFFERTGKMAIGSRLRVLTETMTREASEIYKLYGINLKPKWFPVFYSLMDEQAKSVTAIAREIGQSHPSVSTITKEMLKDGIIEEYTDSDDRRCTMLTLSDKGRKWGETLISQLRDVERAVEELSSECEDDLWRAIGEWEHALKRKSLLERVREIKESREDSEVRIIPYSSEYKTAFFELNRQWIERFWQLEPHDIELLSNPEKHIIDRGGYIYVGLYQGKAVGVCALCKCEDSSPFDYELAKLAVNPAIQRKGLGYKLCIAVIEKARELGAHTIFLESNTRLKPAIALYRKLGFKELPEFHPEYARGNIQMTLKLR